MTRYLRRQPQISGRKEGIASSVPEPPSPPGPARPAQPRWRPNEEQLAILEDFYKQGTPTSQENIDTITELLRHRGPAELNKVYSWFQNKKSRDKRKRRRIEEGAGTSGSFAIATTVAFQSSAASSGKLSSWMREQKKRRTRKKNMRDFSSCR
ncbi:hypothetical protein SELMODRAFT_451015 [Selaginella moellendorffii]|uniref:Uncharacterized protein WOX4-1 n=1 Tax=Selaginella moellendorffii TaxID=88036 RepID=D8S3E7_SELML|nr:hypothetical protein SELMODRAFT_451015 [Selaginella moellendorffii]